MRVNESKWQFNSSIIYCLSSIAIVNTVWLSCESMHYRVQRFESKWTQNKFFFDLLIFIHQSISNIILFKFQAILRWKKNSYSLKSSKATSSNYYHLLSFTLIYSCIHTVVFTVATLLLYYVDSLPIINRLLVKSTTTFGLNCGQDW